jgi:hypothetical protein
MKKINLKEVPRGMNEAEWNWNEGTGEGRGMEGRRPKGKYSREEGTTTTRKGWLWRVYLSVGSRAPRRGAGWLFLVMSYLCSCTIRLSYYAKSRLSLGANICCRSATRHSIHGHDDDDGWEIATGKVNPSFASPSGSPRWFPPSSVRQTGKKMSHTGFITAVSYPVIALRGRLAIA